ncbi:MAG: HDOD domain-containing protein, partial [Nitrospirae bacterium]|nr:HDOD domain-containing protein [Nitrospirota bacterium]
PEWEVERELFGATHAEVGAYVMRLWGLDDTVVEAVAFHHCPARSPARAFSPLTAVHVANALAQEDRASDIGGAPVSIDADYLAALDLTDRLTEWRAISRATSRTET